MDCTLAQSNGHAKSQRELLAEAFWETSLPRLLRCADRNTMAHSIECRVPFLIPDLVQFCFSLTDEYLIGADGVRQSVFRQAMAMMVPKPILNRLDKIGFETPDWLLECPHRVARLLDRDELARA